MMWMAWNHRRALISGRRARWMWPTSSNWLTITTLDLNNGPRGPGGSVTNGRGCGQDRKLKGGDGTPGARNQRSEMTRRKLAKRAPDLNPRFCASAVRVEPDKICSGIYGAS